MKTNVLLFSALAGIAWSGPARRDCEQQCVTASNECAMTYVACRTGCEDAVAAFPTLTAPLCPPNATAAATDAPVDVPTLTSDPAAMITPPPEEPTMKPGYCKPAWICEDAYAVCGGVTTPYGGCYDVCKSNTISVPTCTIAPDPDTEPVRGGLNMKQLERMKQNAADRLAAGGDPCNNADKSQCKPAGW